MELNAKKIRPKIRFVELFFQGLFNISIGKFFEIFNNFFYSFSFIESPVSTNKEFFWQKITLF